MAIQKINLGTEPLGEGGDTYRSANTKINENFSNTTHAASRLVGTNDNNVTQVGAFGIGRTGLRINAPTDDSRVEIGQNASAFNYLGTGLTFTYTMDASATNISGATFPEEVRRVTNFGFSSLNLFNYHDFTASYLQGRIIFTNGHLFTQTVSRDGGTREGTWGTVNTYYHTRNTTKEEGTGYLVASSPVLKMQHDSFEKVHEAEQLDIEVNNIKTGVYEITGTTGLRENDGWNLKPPKDVNGNVLCICEASESNGVITLKTYKKKFDFETVSIVADYEQPTDIPEDATVMLRFNDLPQEELEVAEPEEEPTVGEVEESEVVEEPIEEPEVVEEPTEETSEESE